MISRVQAHLGGLVVDGVAGEKTWSAIARALGVAVANPSAVIATIDGVPVWRTPTARIQFIAGMAIDGDGAPRCYHPISSRGLDHLANAGSPGNWWGIATDSQGEPYVQRATDPAPGFYVSTTALIADATKSKRDPRRYVDASAVPFIVLPSGLAVKAGVSLGDKCRVWYRGKSVDAIYADIGPRDKIGEGSIALARALGIPEDCRKGGVPGGVTYEVL